MWLAITLLLSAAVLGGAWYYTQRDETKAKQRTITPTNRLNQKAAKIPERHLGYRGNPGQYYLLKG